MNNDASSADDGSASPIGRSSTTSNMTPLPDNFEPGPDDVICGRGKKSYNHVGNERFRHRVLTFLDEYSRAKSKLDKSAVLSKVVYEVRQNSPSGGFIKQDTNGVWSEVGDFLAREKTSQAFRDALHDRYKSSNLSKKKRRQEEQAKTHQQTYSKMIGSEYDISSRLDRLSSDVIGSRKLITALRSCGSFSFAVRLTRSRNYLQMELTHLTTLTEATSRCFPDSTKSAVIHANHRPATWATIQ